MLANAENLLSATEENEEEDKAIQKFMDTIGDCLREMSTIITEMNETIKSLKKDNKELKDKINALWYAPGNPGSLEAQEQQQ